MSQPVDEMACFLCGAPAKCQKTDAHNRRLFSCSSLSCGDYEIAINVMKRIEHNANFKAKASALAKSVRGTDKIVEIFADSQTHQVTLRVVPRIAVAL